jgi:hypothetical protein
MAQMVFQPDFVAVHPRPPLQPSPRCMMQQTAFDVETVVHHSAEDGPGIIQRKSPLRHLRRWQFWVFNVLPVLMAIGLSYEVFYLAQKREIAQARDDFYFSAKMIHTNLHMTLQKSIESARLLMGTLLANSKYDFPTEAVFENMVFSNPFFNIDKTIAKVILLSSVANSSRETYPQRIYVLPDMKGAWGGQQKIDPPPSLGYSPVLYVSPPQPDIVGLGSPLHARVAAAAAAAGLVFDHLPDKSSNLKRKRWKNRSHGVVS